MFDINTITMTGTINGEVREADVGDTHVVESEIAFTVPGKDGPKEQWIQLQGWGERGEQLANLAEGTPVIVSGSLNRRAWKDKDDEWQSRYSIRINQVQEMGAPETPVKPPAESQEEIPF